MESLVPPSLDADDSASIVELSVSREGMTRDELLKQFQGVMSVPHPESKALTNEIRAWSGALGSKAWFAQHYNATTALLLTRTKVRVGEAETLRDAVRSCVELVAPLSRYSAGWATSLDPLRPRGVPVVAVREAQRAAARDVRRDMIASVPPVHSTMETLRAFFAYPQERHPRDEYVTLCGYVTRIARAVETGGPAKQPLTEEQRQLLADLVMAVGDERGATPRRQPTEKELAGLRRQAVAFLREVVREQFVDGGYDQELMAEAFERVVRTYVNRLILGKPLEGTEYYLKLRLSAVRIDAWRAEQRKRKNEGSFVAGADRGSSRADDRIEDTTAPESDVDVVGVLMAAAAMIEADELNRIAGQLNWEATMACALLRQDLLTSDAPTRHDLQEAVAAAWAAGAPQNAISASSKAAVMRVLLLMRTSATRARKALNDEFDEGAAS